MATCEGEISNYYDRVPEVPTSYLTPINHNRAPIQSSSPLKTLHRRGLDSDSLYKLPDDDEPLEPKSRGKKRTCNQLNKEHLVSLGNVWEDHDDDQGFEVFPEKKKPALKRCKSMVVQPINYTEEGDEIAEKLKANSQLTILANTSKRPRKLNSTSSKRKTKQASLFQGSAVTNPSMHQKKSVAKEFPFSQSISHQGWTTTEDTFRLNSNMLAKTTLDMLAAFKYEGQYVGTSPLKSVQMVDGTGKRENGCVPQLSEYDLSPTDDLFFNDPVWMNEAGDQGNDHLENQISGGNAMNDHVPNVAVFSSGSTMPGTGSPVRTEPTIYFIGPCSTLGASKLPQDSQYYEPTSSENMLNDETDNSHLVAQNIKAWTVSSEDNPIEPYEDRITLLECSTRTNASLEVSGAGCVVGLPPHSLVFSQLVDCESVIRTTNVQVERSGVDDVEIDENVHKDFASDDFDEGLSESDLLGVMSDVLVSEPPPSSHLKEQTTKDLSQTNPNAPPNMEIQLSRLQVNSFSDHHAKASMARMAPNALHDDADYPMDEEDEEEMSRLLVETSVKENFAPPVSLQFAFDDESVTREIYDSSLKFSPPKLQASIRTPSKATGQHSADSISPRPPNIQSDSDPMLMGEEEDWNFIRSHGIRTIDLSYEIKASLQPASDPKITAPFKPLSISSSRTNDGSCVQIRTTQTSTETWMLVDDSHEYEPLRPFARPHFPALVQGRCPVIGVSSQTILRTCFRIGEMLHEGARCNFMKQDAIIELFARVIFSSHEVGTTKQHFQFADLWHDRPPFPNGIMACKPSGLAEAESKVFLDSDKGQMARCLGRLKRDVKKAAWVLDVIQIRLTDWEEIKYTKRIVSGDSN
ncbi:hypothetical protein B7494_g6201 [Chlorociboria aeruginascens]|nr:hypothetical protein B7494_g6201 [Chlorociboria aeruginascens]